MFVNMSIAIENTGVLHCQTLLKNFSGFRNFKFVVFKNYLINFIQSPKFDLVEY